jgi:AsmA-like C-terminal region
MSFLQTNKILKFLCYSALVFLVIFIFLINSFPWFLQIGFLQNQLFQTITKQKQISLSAKDIDIDLFPHPALRLKNLIVKSDDIIECKLQSIKIYPDYKQLIQGNLIVTKCAIQKTNLTFKNNYKPSAKIHQNPSTPFTDITSLFKTSRIDKFIDKDKGLLIQIRNFRNDFAERSDATVKISHGDKINGTITITGFDLNKRILKKYDFNKNIFNLNSKPLKSLILVNNLKIDFNRTKNKTLISLAPTTIQYPSMSLGINFSNDKKAKKAHLEFKGKNVNIDLAKKAYFNLFNKEEISENLFDIVRSGNAPKISVLFKANTLTELLRPSNMILKGELENGKIKIPNTPLIPEKVFGAALIQNGILYIKAEKGNLKHSHFNNGTLNIDLLNQPGYPFDGSFQVHAPLADIQSILIQSFPDTLLSDELKLVKNAEGVVAGELLLDLKSGGELDVIVNIDKVSGSGDYSRAPGKIKIYLGSFQYKDDIITLTDMGGKIGNSYFYNFTGAYTADDTSLLDIKSGKALINSNEVFSWLMGFKGIKSFFPDMDIKKGFLQIDSTSVRGDILQPAELIFNVAGSLQENLIKQKLYDQDLVPVDPSKGNIESKGIYLTHSDFEISDKELLFDKINAKISHIGIIPRLNKNNEIENIATPITLNDSSYKSTKNFESFKGIINFTDGVQVDISTRINNNDQFLIKELKVTDGELSNAIFSTNKRRNIDFNNFTGQICTKTLEKVFKKDSAPYNELIGYTDKQKIIIKSKKKNTYTISADTINFEPFITKIISKNNFFSTRGKKDTFPNKLIILHTGSLKYKKSDFNNFKADISIKKNIKGINGNLNLKSKDGKILSLTMLSRILSVVNISTLFKGKLPDVNQQGFKYKDISFKAKIVDNKIVIKEAVIDGHDMALVFKGTFDTVKNDLDLTCLVAPFKTIDMLIEKIPLINTMLNNTLISIPVKVSGKIEDPKVVIMHPVSVGKGIINLMTNIIKTPVKLLDKLPVKSKSGDTEQ